MLNLGTSLLKAGHNLRGQGWSWGSVLTSGHIAYGSFP